MSSTANLPAELLVVTRSPLAMMFALTMEGPSTNSVLKRLSLGSGLGAGLLATLFFTALFTPPVAAQATAARPDQIYKVNVRKGTVSAVPGIVTENSLDAVRFTHDNKEQKLASDEVVKIVWGKVPVPFEDGLKYSERGDHENAVGSFKLAATDAGAREVVKAAARFRAASELFAWGGTDPNQFTACVEECDKFLSGFTNDRHVPKVRNLRARALLLTGDARAAAEAYKSLYEEGANEPATKGYDRELCLDAGLDAAHAYLAAGDTLAARELFATIEGSLRSMAAEIADERSPIRVRLVAAQGEAVVGEGFCMLAGGQASQAITFFQGRIARAPESAAERQAASLGLAEAFLANGQNRLAQVEFARVSATDPRGGDSAARALVGLADSTLRLQDKDAVASAKTWLTQVRDHYGNTPSARKAAELLKTL